MKRPSRPPAVGRAASRRSGAGAWSPLRALVVVAALALKVLVPAGFMLSPAAAGAGLAPIVLCTGSGEMRAFMDAEGRIVEAAQADDPAGDADHDPDGPCGFAAHAAAVGQPSLSAAVALRVDDDPGPASRSVDLAPGRGLAAPPPPATAPPASI